METDPKKKPFTPEVLDKTVIAIPLLDELKKDAKKTKKDRKPIPVIIDINLEYRQGASAARERIRAELAEAIAKHRSSARVQQGINEAKSELSEQYFFASLEGPVIRALVKIDNEERKESDEPGARL